MITTVKPLGSTILDRIGNTPLLRLDGLLAHLGDAAAGIQILGKAEWANPGGSVKDRAASAIVADGLNRGLLSPTRSLLDATSGNTGIAYAMLGAALHFPVTLCMPSNVSPERKKSLAAHAAHVVCTNPPPPSHGDSRNARTLAAPDPSRSAYADQHRTAATQAEH